MGHLGQLSIAPTKICKFTYVVKLNVFSEKWTQNKKNSAYHN